MKRETRDARVKREAELGMMNVELRSGKQKRGKAELPIFLILTCGHDESIM